MMRAMIDASPVGRLGTPEDIAAGVFANRHAVRGIRVGSPSRELRTVNTASGSFTSAVG